MQIALRRGARVIATAGRTFSGALATMDAQATSYGDGLARRAEVQASEAGDATGLGGVAFGRSARDAAGSR